MLGVERSEPFVYRQVLRQRVRRSNRPAARGRAMPFGTLRVDPLIEGEAPEHEVEALAADIIAQFLRILVLLRGVLRLGDHRQAGEIAIILGLPVPITPRGDRGQRARPDIPFDAQRNPADLVAGVRSEAHTSELQSLMRISYAVFCLEKTKTQDIKHKK